MYLMLELMRESYILSMQVEMNALFSGGELYQIQIDLKELTVHDLMQKLYLEMAVFERYRYWNLFEEIRTAIDL